MLHRLYLKQHTNTERRSLLHEKERRLGQHVLAKEKVSTIVKDGKNFEKHVDGTVRITRL